MARDGKFDFDDIDATAELTISQMAKLNGVSEKALRLYHKKGALIPIRIDEKNVYRFYSINQCVTVDVIKQMQMMGFSIEETAQALTQDDPDEYERLTAEKLAQLEEQIRLLAQAKRTGERYMMGFDAWRTRSNSREITIEHRKERTIYRLGIRNPRINTPGISGQHLLEEWELHLRILRQEFRNQGLPQDAIYHVNAFFTARGDNPNSYEISDTFIYLNKSFSEIFDRGEVIPEGDYLVLYYDTVIGEDGSYTTLSNVTRLHEYAREHGLATTGPCCSLVLADTPFLIHDGRDMVYKCCLPIATTEKQ